tara:strand:- start:508 stop:1758 length:1251 start_codon:yes stop_codon:yes gene_type:complete
MEILSHYGITVRWLLLGILIIVYSGPCSANTEEDVNTQSVVFSKTTGLKSIHFSGVRPYGLLTAEIVANLEGGNETGSTGLGLFDFGIDLDFEEIRGWDGTHMHLGALAIFGGDPSTDLVGDFNVLSNIAAFNTVRLFQAWLQKEWLEGTIAIRIGNIALDDDFMVSENAGLFLNSAFGPLPTESGNISAPIYPLGAPGIWTKVSPTDSSYFQLAVYSGDAGDEIINDNGLEFSLGGDRGYVIFLEYGVEAHIHSLPGSYKFGGFYHTGDFENLGTGLTVEGNSSIYFSADQTLFTESDPDQRLGSFFRIGYSPSEDHNTVRFYNDFGLTYNGMFPGRDSDIFGIAFSITRFGDTFLIPKAAARDSSTKTERILEITYQIPITQNIILKPDLQVIFDPLEGENDAFIFGLRVDVVF